MKRSALKRTKGLARGDKPLKHGDAQLSRAKGLAPVGAKKRAALAARTPQDTARIQRMREQWIRDVEDAFRDERGTMHCAVCDRTPDQLTRVDHRGRKLHGHHVIEQQRLKVVARQRGIPAEYLLWDGRGGLLVCVQCHLDHHGVRRIPHRALTYSNLCFASDVGEEVYVERTYPIRPFRGDRG